MGRQKLPLVERLFAERRFSTVCCQMHGGKMERLLAFGFELARYWPFQQNGKVFGRLEKSFEVPA